MGGIDQGDLLKDDAITQVDVEQRRGFELKIEIPRSALQQYSLTMDQISQIIQQSTLDMPGGKIETSGGDLLVRTKERRYSASEYARIPLLKNGQGTLLLVTLPEFQMGLRNRSCVTATTDCPPNGSLFTGGRADPD